MLIFGIKPERRRQLRGLLRVFGYFTVVGLALGGVRLRHARAEVDSQAIQLGRQMMKLSSAKQQDTYHATVNGQSIFMANSLATNDTTKGVLDRYEAYCKANAAQSPEDWRKLATARGADKPTPELFKVGMLRSGSDDEGAVLCFTKTAKSKGSLQEAIEAFGQTGDVGAFGAMRYVYAKKTEKGNTHVLAVWSDDKFVLADFIPPEDGTDAPGKDWDGIPRVPNAQRVLSAHLDGTPFGLNVYSGKEHPEKVVSHMDETMNKLGWVALDPEVEQIEKQEPGHDLRTRIYEKDGVLVTLASRVQEEGLTMTGFGVAGVGELDHVLKRAAPVSRVP